MPYDCNKVLTIAYTTISSLLIAYLMRVNIIHWYETSRLVLNARKRGDIIRLSSFYINDKLMRDY